MRVTKQILAFLLAAALLAGGTVRGMAAVEPCVPTHHNDSHPAHAGDHAHAADHAHASHHDHAGDHAHHHQADNKQAPAHKSCLECCGICVTAASGMSAALSGSLHRFASAISYALASGAWCGEIVAVDPGIPKRIV